MKIKPKKKSKKKKNTKNLKDFEDMKEQVDILDVQENKILKEEIYNKTSEFLTSNGEELFQNIALKDKINRDSIPLKEEVKADP